MNKKMTSAEIGKLWTVHMGNTLSKCVLSYFLQHVEDPEIKTVVNDALNLTNDLLERTDHLFKNENSPVPIGLTEKDVDLDAPRLYSDLFYLYYLKYVTKAGLSIYSTAIPLMMREDVKEFILYSNSNTIELINKVKGALDKKGYLQEPATIPIPENVMYISKQSYLNGFLGEVRPLHALEIAHLFDNIENNITSKALLTGFTQVAKKDDVKSFLLRGKKMAMHHIQQLSEKLSKEDLPSPPLIDDLVEASTISPFSDKLMMTHKIDMFSMKIRTYANAMSLNGRRDIGATYGKLLFDIGRYVEDGANIMIDHGWMEQPPHAVNRDQLGSN
ncbi:DUF3231 family protein [Mesobacillus maritimus]|uniref:DUF3231 family protein n=1 Tax=Mesobacillus maritimus TaxID=1643336 RepID=A0ABS7K1Z9_9BACI|nr:DUF3231 family protein [Mesobacillus maritimus]MBY0096195.1 DUF3231 family protein [Mesobacillus maritimus]